MDTGFVQHRLINAIGVIQKEETNGRAAFTVRSCQFRMDVERLRRFQADILVINRFESLGLEPEVVPADGKADQSKSTTAVCKESGFKAVLLSANANDGAGNRA
jgi:hypothetical protein